MKLKFMSELNPKIAESDDEIENCFDVMAELRTHLKRLVPKMIPRQARYSVPLKPAWAG